MRSEGTALNRRSVWGVSPQAVENLIADHGREVQTLHARIAELESRTGVLTAQRDEAGRRALGEQVATQNRVAELESRLATSLARAKASEEELSLLRESADRINVLREEAVQVVADAWAMAQAIEERTQQLVVRTREELRADAAALQARMDDEKARHRQEIERLGKQRVQMLMQLEATARGLLDHATLIKNDSGNEAATAEVVSGLNAAVRTLNATATAAAGTNVPFAASPSPPAAAETGRGADTAPPPSPSPSAHDNGAAEEREDAVTLANALNELEDLLNLPRERWQGRTKPLPKPPPDGPTRPTNGTRPNDDLLNRLRTT